ncbi:MAG: hypothetical protein IIZ61_04425 [Lachnospiraceae bacterium]|nr:hypothetical protein [Lachnospiraceae bacterium]
MQQVIVVMTCPCCGRKFEITSAYQEHVYSQSGYVPLFCTLDCQLRFSNGGK